ncbi:MAG TPA: UdgX family uracil-DNA binding protein [Solirubrobacteraceae bacterium]|jgi:uracil-DNA glycosylase|nr:UdgX family uracil-DNA binding protein [Solirubrobacteraceae bacterium]
MPKDSAPDASAFLPERPTLKRLREAAAGCRGCGLWRDATQTVFGEGLKRARIMLVGEMPGDREDLAGRPFVGPAGRELDRGLEAAGIDRRDAYVTNVVKHFKFTRRGKRRIHQRPRQQEVAACHPWLQAELDQVRPEALVLLGSTAAKALLGSGFTLTRHRGDLLESALAPIVAATVHPSSIIRAPDDESRHLARRDFTDDLRAVAAAIAARRPRRAA